MDTKWSEDPTLVGRVDKALEEVYSGLWGLKASPRDAVMAAAQALDVELTNDAEGLLSDLLWKWQNENPSPFVQGLIDMVEDGLRPGAVVPEIEIAGSGESEVWGRKEARFLLDAIQEAQGG